MECSSAKIMFDPSVYLVCIRSNLLSTDLRFLLPVCLSLFCPFSIGQLDHGSVIALITL